jgi:hypothetical protein
MATKITALLVSSIILLIATSTNSKLHCCNLSSREREKKLLELYSTVSNKIDIKTKDSPQNKAFYWILNKDKYCVCPSEKGCEPIQRYVMAVYYYSTKGKDLVNCGASSVTCDLDGVLNNGSNTSVCYHGADQQWLSNVPSCKWCSNNCDDPLYSDCIAQINLGKNTVPILLLLLPPPPPPIYSKSGAFILLCLNEIPRQHQPRRNYPTRT